MDTAQCHRTSAEIVLNRALVVKVTVVCDKYIAFVNTSTT